MRKMNLSIGILAFAVLIGCQDDIVSPDTELALKAEDASSQVLSKAGAQLGGMIWADGELFGTVGTPTQFKPGHGPFDVLFQGSFRDGVGAISESKPGDQDFNGGRWEVWHLKAGVTTDYSSADSAEDLDVSDFEPAGVYFECPLLPRRGGGHN